MRLCLVGLAAMATCASLALGAERVSSTAVGMGSGRGELSRARGAAVGVGSNGGELSRAHGAAVGVGSSGGELSRAHGAAVGVGSSGGELSRAHGAAVMRTWLLTLSPDPGRLELAQIWFHRAGRQSISRRSLRVSLSGPFGDDYLAVAALRSVTAAGPRALVLLVNRASPLLDPAHVRIRITSRRSLGRARLLSSTDAFAPVGGTPPAVCDLPEHGAALTGSDLRPLAWHGSGLAGFDAANAVAQAYDAVCGLPYAGAFERAVTPAPPPPAPPAPPPLPPAPPAPAPAPAPVPPGCTPCDPPPGYACPLLAAPGICVAAPPGAARRTLAGPH